MMRSQDGLLWKSPAKTRVESTLTNFTPHQEMIDTVSKVVIASYTVAGFSRSHSFVRDFFSFPLQLSFTPETGKRMCSVENNANPGHLQQIYPLAASTSLDSYEMALVANPQVVR